MFLNIHENMIEDFKERYFKVNRILLLTIGLWPYQQSRYVLLQAILIYSILISGVLFQVTTFLTRECTSDFIIKVISCTIPFVGTFILYNTFCSNTEILKYMLDELQRVYSQLKEKNEISIVEYYGRKAKNYTKILRVSVAYTLLMVILLPLLSRFLEAFLFRKEVRKRQVMLIATEYFVDQEKYFYVIRLHLNTIVCTLGLVLLALGTMFLVYYTLIFGMFKIASYRIQNAIPLKITKNIVLENEIITIIRMNINRGVEIHREAMQLSTIFVSACEKKIFIMMTMLVASLSLNLYRIASTKNNTEEILLNLLFIAALFISLFIPNYMGQKIKDYNNDVFLTAYKLQWYKAPLSIQRLILLLLQRGNKVFILQISGGFSATLECFASLTSASLSYFTFMCSMA